MATTFGVSAGDYIRPWRNCVFKEFPVHTSQTVLLGSSLQIAGAGYENRVILSTDTTVSGIVGIAMEAITTTSTHYPKTDKVLVALAQEDAEFAARTVADTAVDFSHIGANYELEIDGTYGITRVQTDGQTYEVVKVLAFVDPITRNVQATEGDTSALCIFKFLPGATVYGVGIILQ